jgi:glycosyltransferase involved in cell wall biosynthesis
MTSVAFSWYGLPQYGARLLRGALDVVGNDCTIVASRPTVPVEGMERALRHPIHWVDANAQVSWRELGLGVPRVYFQSGWGYPAFTSLGAEVKAQGGKIVGLSDANWRGDFRQFVLGPVGFRLRHRAYFDAMFVPGCQGQRVMRWFGMPQDRIRTGLYGADPALFKSQGPLAARPKTFLFVGQFIERKDVLGLAKAFTSFAADHPDWTLHLIGGGEQRALIPDHPRIIVEEFVQPEQLAERFARARFFVLPSLVEAWGLVVHEAALSGCGLVLSDCIGSADDLSNSVNRVRSKAGDSEDLARALAAAAAFDADRLAAAETTSLEYAATFGPERFGREVVGLLQSLLAE